MQAVVFPDPTGPAATRPKALDRIKRPNVNGAVYSMAIACCFC
jgi:hypothetical protein